MVASALTLNPRLCDRCGRCLAQCPAGALSVGRTYLRVDPSLCTGCGACAHVCARRAITMKTSSKKTAAKAAAARPAARPASRPVARPAPRPAARRTAEPASHESARQQRGGKSSAARQSARQVAGARVPFHWTIVEAAALLAVTLAAFLVKEALSQSLALQGLPSTLHIFAGVSLLALYYMVQVAVLVWLIRRRDGNVLAALRLTGGGTTFKHALTSALLVVVSLVAVRLVSSVYAYITRELGMLPSSSVDLPALFGNDISGFMLAVVMVVIIGPLVEEAVFRGALLEGLAVKLGMWPAILIQAAIFSALHRSLWLLLPMFVLGVVLGWLARKRESLWPSIALHAFYNGITVAAAFLVIGSS